MRAAVCLLLVAVCLAVVAGCQHTKPPLPPAPLTPTGGSATFPRADGNTPANADGLIAGQVLDSFGNHPDNVSIQLVDLQDTGPTPGKIEVEPKEKGYFMIQGLQVGRHYQLIARLKDGTKLLSGTTVCTPPNPRVTIFLSEDNTIDSTPQPPGPPSIPTKPKPIGVGATIDPPRRMEPPVGDGENPPHKGTTLPAGGGPVIPAPPGSGTQPPISTPAKVNPSNVAEGKNGFGSFVPAPAKIDYLPKPPTTPVDPPPAKEPPKSDKPAASTDTTPNNSCVLVGKKLEDFALTTLDGNGWQFKRDHKGSLVLLDFWSTRNDLSHIHQLRELVKVYGSYGLEVVGLAYEEGTPEQQVSNIRPVRGRYTINYPTLLGGPWATCQVKKQFEINQLPTLILLDGQGNILLRVDPSDRNQSQELETEIRKKLGVAATLQRAGE